MSGGGSYSVDVVRYGQTVRSDEMRWHLRYRAGCWQGLGKAARLPQAGMHSPEAANRTKAQTGAAPPAGTPIHPYLEVTAGFKSLPDISEPTPDKGLALAVGSQGAILYRPSCCLDRAECLSQLNRAIAPACRRKPLHLAMQDLSKTGAQRCCGYGLLRTAPVVGQTDAKASDAASAALRCMAPSGIRGRPGQAARAAGAPGPMR